MEEWCCALLNNPRALGEVTGMTIIRGEFFHRDFFARLGMSPTLVRVRYHINESTGRMHIEVESDRNIIDCQGSYGSLQHRREKSCLTTLGRILDEKLHTESNTLFFIKCRHLRGIHKVSRKGVELGVVCDNKFSR